MNTKRQPALQDPVTNSTHAYLSGRVADLHFLGNNRGSQRRLSRLSLQTKPSQKPERALRGSDQLLPSIIGIET